MTTPPPPPPKLRNIALGILVAVLVVLLLCSASSAVKWAGAPFLVVPRILGILESVRSDEIVAVPMAAPPTSVTFPQAEVYAVYTADLSLLEITSQLIESDSPPWLVVQRAATGESIPVELVDRGLLPYDEPRAPGRPVLRFEIVEPGTYAMTHPRREVAFYLVPDRTTGREAVIVASYVIQLTLLAFPLFLVFGRPWLDRRRRWQAHQRERRTASGLALRQAAERRARSHRPTYRRRDP